MSKLDRYLEAATRDNTRRSYASAVRHFEIEWGGHLPATPDSVANYLAAYAGRLAINTLKQRLAALAQWHTEQGFVDPTSMPLVRKVLKGVQAVHPQMEKQAEPLQILQLTQISQWLTGAMTDQEITPARALMYRRDHALVLLGFWRGFRTDELMRLRVEHIRLVANKGMTCFLPRTKGDRQNQGNTFTVPALSRLCPVTAVREWISAAALTEGPVFRSVGRWGQIGQRSLHPNSFVPLLRRLFTDAALSTPEVYSGHSLRRGFAGWANDNGWDVKTLMEYVGWKDMRSALRYIDSDDPFHMLLVKETKAQPLSLAAG